MTLLPATVRLAAERVTRARSVVVCGHVRPDGDAVGSTLGLVLALRGCGIDAVPTLADENGRGPATYAFLPGFATYTPVAALAVPDVFVALDTPNLDRLGIAADLASEAAELIVIDHHPDNSGFGTLDLVDPGAAAVGQMLWRLLPELGRLRGLEPSSQIATCLYCALLTDTGGFRYSNTTAEALRDAASMLQAGADPSDISRSVYEERSPGAVGLAGRALSRLEIVNGGLVAVSWIDDADLEATGALPEETEHLVDMLRMLGGVEALVFFQIANGECRVNLRSKSGFDVGSVARGLGGGGHAAAAGLTFNGTRIELLDALLPLLPGGAPR